MAREETPVKIENVVATAALKHGIDLNAMVKAFPSVEYRPEEFPGVILRLKRPKTCTLIFASGKMVCTGARSEREARMALRKVARMLRKSGMVVAGKPEIKIQNIVATASLGGKADLVGFVESHGRDMGGRLMYEPDQFPGLIYRMNDPRAIFLIFSSGKLVCTGARKEEEARQAVEKLHRKLREDDTVIYATPKDG